MEDIKYIPGGVTAPLGFTANGICCGIRKNKLKPDLAMIFSEVCCTAAAVYTQNLVKGAPIYVTKENISDGFARAVICNSGIANTCNADGVEKAQGMCDIAAGALGLKREDIIVASTGVIGMPLNLEPVKNGINELVSGLGRDGSDRAAKAIMTTDTRKKEFAVEFELSGKKCRIGVISKGSGMINPNMATMLGFITTDVKISSDMLCDALHEAVRDTYNMVSVDGDTSTNDMVSIMASGLADNDEIIQKNGYYDKFVNALYSLCKTVARELARDGEGATKLVVCRTVGAAQKSVAKTVAKSVICSNLVKAAMFGADANWGRILCAIGYAGEDVDITKVDVKFISKKGELTVCVNGSGVYVDEGFAKELLSENEIYIVCDLKSGDYEAEAYGCDLTYDYVKINGDYRT